MSQFIGNDCLKQRKKEKEKNKEPTFRKICFRATILYIFVIWLGAFVMPSQMKFSWSNDSTQFQPGMNFQCGEYDKCGFVTQLYRLNGLLKDT